MKRRPNIAKRLLMCVLCFVCLMTAMLSAYAETPNQELQTQPTDATGYASIVRNSASFGSADIGSMKDGTAVTVLAQKGNFYKIDCYDMTGYVAKSQVEEKDGTYYIHCDPASSETEQITYTEHVAALELRHSLLALARKQVGKPYIYGSTGPRGFDCSGLTTYLYKNHGVGLYRTAEGQLADGVIVSKEGMQVGDLIFFRKAGDTTLASHVGIYAGDNKMIHAGSKGIACVELTGFYYEGNFLCARRVINTDCSGQSQTAVVASLGRTLPASGISGRRAG